MSIKGSSYKQKKFDNEKLRSYSVSNKNCLHIPILDAIGEHVDRHSRQVLASTCCLVETFHLKGEGWKGKTSQAQTSQHQKCQSFNEGQNPGRTNKRAFRTYDENLFTHAYDWYTLCSEEILYICR